MKIDYFDIKNKTGEYPINCKRFTPEGPCRGVVLGVHGFVGDKESKTLTGLGTACAQKNVALVCFDFPAHGASEAKEDRLTVANCVSDLLTVADLCRRDHPGEKKYLFATSFGGYVSLLCARDLPEFGFVLRAPAVTMGEHVLIDLLKVTPEEFARRSFIRFGYDRKIDVPYAFYRELLDRPLVEHAPDRPVLILHGDKDGVVPLEDVVSFCASRKNALLRIVEGVGHSLKTDEEVEKVVGAALDYWGV